MNLKQKFKRDIWIIIAILLIPVLAYAYLLFPNEPEIKIFGLTLNGGYYGNIQVLAWVIVQKLMFVITFMLWYSTVRQWWRNGLLVPLTVFIFQLIMVLYPQETIVDEYEIVFSAVISIPIVYGFYLLVMKIERKLEIRKMYKGIELEVESLILELSNDNKEHYKNFKEQLKQLKISKNNMDKNTYLNKLLTLKDQLSP